MAPVRQRDGTTAIEATLQTLPFLHKKLLGYSLPDPKVPDFQAWESVQPAPPCYRLLNFKFKKLDEADRARLRLVAPGQ